MTNPEHAWIDTWAEDADGDGYEELDNATNALILVHAGILAARQSVKQ